MIVMIMNENETALSVKNEPTEVSAKPIFTGIERFELTPKQTEILYNLEYLKVLNDAESTSNLPIRMLKGQWLEEWMPYAEQGYRTMMQNPNAKLHWYDKIVLQKRIEESNPEEKWFSLALLEAMFFEPYFPIGFEENLFGKLRPDRKYHSIQSSGHGYQTALGDHFLGTEFLFGRIKEGYIEKLRETYTKAEEELSQETKVSASKMAGKIGFASFSTNASSDVIMTIVGGGDILASERHVSSVGLAGREVTVMQTAKLLVSMKEIFLHMDHDHVFFEEVYTQFQKNASFLTDSVVELKLKENLAPKEEKKRIKKMIRNLEESAKAMKRATICLYNISV